MKLLVTAVLLAVAAARPQRATIEAEEQVVDPALREAGLLKYVSEQKENGDFHYTYVTADNIAQDGSGEIKQIGDKSGVVMQGGYFFVTKDEFGNNVTVEVVYVADENGFQPEFFYRPDSSEI